LADDSIKIQVKEASDIVEVASRYLRLKKSGKDFVALCPFHREKTPSFHINTQGQYYYCFGCGKKGDVFTLVMEMEALPFPEALASLAAHAGISIHKGRSTEEIQQARRVADAKITLFKMMAEAQEFFRNSYLSDAGKKARDYAESRKFTPEIIEAFGLGYAPDSWEDLHDHMNRKGVNDKWLFSAGLVRKSDAGKIYDYFRNRLTFPIRNVEGKIIAFGARALDKDDEPKYLNSPETPVFRKGLTLYGLDKARRTVNSTGNIIIVEGYTDVMMAHQAGIENTVATLGTALTRDNSVIIGRLAEKVTLVFDGDAAGRTACQRALEVLIPLGIDARVVMLPAEEDPASLVAAGRQQEFIDAVSAARDGLSWWLDVISEGVSTQQGRVQAAKTAAELVRDVDIPTRRQIMQEIEKRFYVENVDKLWTTTPASIVKEIDKQKDLVQQHRKSSELSSEDMARVELLARAALAPDKLPEAVAELEGIPDPSILQMLHKIADIARSGSISGKEVIEQLMAEGDQHELLVEVAARLAKPTSQGRLSSAAELKNAVLFYKRAMLKKQYRELSATLDTSKGYVEQIQALRREINKVETAMQEMQRS